MSRRWSFIKRVCLCTSSAGHCDTVWYVESYKQLALNSICKINSPRAAAAHISLLPSPSPRPPQPPVFFLRFSFVYHAALSQTHPSNQVWALSSLFATSLALSCAPPPIHFQDITDLTGHFVVIDAVARGPAGGRRHLGTGSALRGQRLGFGVMGVVGTILREGTRVGVLISELLSLGQVLPRLPPCRSVTLLLPAVTKPPSV